jgi:hypothetical protein
MTWKKFFATLFGIVLGTFVLILLILAGTYILTRPETPVAQLPEVVQESNSNESNSTETDLNESNSQEMTSQESNTLEVNALETNSTETIDFGIYGEYEIVFDSNRSQDTLGWWNENMVRVGTKNLADLKREGGTITFVMPRDGWINNSAGMLFVDGIQWDLGNYGENPSQETIILAGQTITVSYEALNDSAGFQLWFK